MAVTIWTDTEPCFIDNDKKLDAIRGTEANLWRIPACRLNSVQKFPKFGGGVMIRKQGQ